MKMAISASQGGAPAFQQNRHDHWHGQQQIPTQGFEHQQEILTGRVEAHTLAIEGNVIERFMCEQGRRASEKREKHPQPAGTK